MISPYSFRRRDLRHITMTLHRHLAIMAFVTLLMALMIPDIQRFWVAFLAAPLLVIDASSKRLPDLLTVLLLVGSLIYAGLAADDALVRLSGSLYFMFGLWAIAYLGFRINDRMVLGGGDIKLIVCFPLLVGFLEATGVVLLACLIQGASMLMTQLSRDDAMPFGPSLIVALIVGIALT